MLEIMSQPKSQSPVTKERGPGPAGVRGSSPGSAKPRSRDEGTGPWPSGGPEGGLPPRASKARQRT
jgi:hypothetical protein